ncbi:hypothetical protein [Roseicella sp. DB1501]|uniref:hypothetical protein n=1 Tax=Roseicella sp. DB1501 TaxID=2730925 RepID=UPI00149235BE|nr:hypothetical protein [Roseicella sp. DB1501]NOG69826.1 hypothetical protein [Roseicella sp. DB1501]
MSSEAYDIEVCQGATFAHTLTLADVDPTTKIETPVNLAGYTARMQVRRKLGDATAIITLTTENGRIVISPSTGVISLTISATDTAALPIGQAVYDLEIVKGAVVTRLLAGRCIVSGEVTRDSTSSTTGTPAYDNGDTYANRSAATSAMIAPTKTTITLQGYSAPGDGGGARYNRVSTQPAHLLCLQSADGAWWEMVRTPQIDARVAGIFPARADASGSYSTITGTADCATGLNNLIDYLRAQDPFGYDGAVIWFCEGVWNFRSPVTPHRATVFRAAGNRNTSWSYRQVDATLMPTFMRFRAPDLPNGIKGGDACILENIQFGCQEIIAGSSPVFVVDPNVDVVCRSCSFGHAKADLMWDVQGRLELIDCTAGWGAFYSVNSSAVAFYIHNTNARLRVRNFINVTGSGTANPGTLFKVTAAQEVQIANLTGGQIATMVEIAPTSGETVFDVAITTPIITVTTSDAIRLNAAGTIRRVSITEPFISTAGNNNVSDTTSCGILATGAGTIAHLEINGGSVITSRGHGIRVDRARYFRSSASVYDSKSGSGHYIGTQVVSFDIHAKSGSNWYGGNARYGVEIASNTTTTALAITGDLRGNTLGSILDGAQTSAIRRINAIRDDSAALTVGSGATLVDLAQPTRFPGYAFSGVPAAASNSGCTIRITDRNHKLATSDGTAWRFADGTVIA